MANLMDVTDPQSSQIMTTTGVAAASDLLIKDPTVKTNRTTAATPPFFRLPRELRDQIYDLVALSENTIYYDIALQVGEPPQKRISVARDASRSRSQFEVEYSAAVERRVKSLFARSELSGKRFASPGAPTLKETKDVWLRISKARADGGFIQNIHLVKMTINLLPPERLELKEHLQKMILVLEFVDSEDLGPRQDLIFPWARLTEGLRIECPPSFVLPPGCDPLVQQSLSLTKAVNWKGALREYMLWQTYFVRYARKALEKER